MTDDRPNVIADGRWNLTISCTPKNFLLPSIASYNVTFLPDGSIDPSSSDIDKANQLLPSGLDQPYTWSIVNWVVVSYYWVFLRNFGTLAPTTYGFLHRPPEATIVAFGSPNFSDPIPHNATNNIFVNRTLFQTYYDILRNISQLFSLISPAENYTNLSAFNFTPIDQGGNNSLKNVDVFINATYFCNIRQVKGWPNMLVSVFIADWTLIIGAYTFFIWIGRCNPVARVALVKEERELGTGTIFQ